jgi:hypothetical protein
MQLIEKAQRKARRYTLALSALLLLALLSISAQLPSQEKTYEIEILEDLEEDYFKNLEEKRFEAFKIETNQASNEAATKSALEAPEPLASLEELSKRRSENGSAVAEGFGSGLNSISSAVEDRLNRMKANSSTPGEPIKLAKKTIISYDLKGRVHQKLPVPNYTCLEGGEVVINVSVDYKGRVIDAWYNPYFSSSSNGCLIAQAIEYARRSLFQESGKNVQEGTITYLFPAK